ncbi:MAG: ribonuclease D [Chloroflexota bacterium]
MSVTALTKTPQLIQTTPGLDEVISHLSSQSIIAVDTESNSLYAYQERVCLIQISTREEDFLIDPFAFTDLSSLNPLFQNAGLEKVFHAAEYDIICLRRDYHFSFENLFDTMIAARILGRKEVGLGSMLEAEFGIHLNKRFQRANWGQRPLPADLLLYAKDDTHYLLPLRDKLRDELEKRQLLPLAQEDFQRMCHNSEHECSNGKGDDCWRISGAYDLPPETAAILQELCNYRDRMARRFDRPLFKVFSDQVLLHLAQHRPSNLEELARIPGLSHRQIERHGRALLQAIQKGLHSPPIYPNRPSRPSDAYLSRLDSLRTWRKTIAQRMGVPSDVVLPRDVMLRLAAASIHSAEDLQITLADVPWRLAHFGDQLLSLLT